MKRGIAVVLAAAVTAMLLSGCGQSKPQPQPAIDFTAEQNGESLVIRAQPAGFQMGKDGHLHLFLDNGPETMAYQSTYTFPKVAPGKHTVTVGLSDMNHKNIGITQTKEVEMK